MNEIVFIQMPKAEFAIEIMRAVKLSLSEYEKEKATLMKDQCFTINKVAKRLKKSHATIKKLIHSGHLQATSSGLIPEWTIQEYLHKV